MSMMKRRAVEKYLFEMRQVVDAVDTPTEVRALPSYAFILGVSDTLTEMGMPADMAARAACRVSVQLPHNFNHEYPAQFAELVRLISKSTFAILRAVLNDYQDDVVEEVFLSLCDQASVSLEW